MEQNWSEEPRQIDWKGFLDVLAGEVCAVAARHGQAEGNIQAPELIFIDRSVMVIGGYVLMKSNKAIDAINPMDLDPGFFDKSKDVGWRLIKRNVRPPRRQ